MRTKCNADLVTRSCQFRHSADHTNALRAIDNTLSVHSAHLRSIQSINSAQLELSKKRESLVVSQIPLLANVDESSGQYSLKTSLAAPHCGHVEAEDEEELHSASTNHRRIHQQYKEARQQTRRFVARIRLPFWLTRRIWDVAAVHSHGCWTITMKTFNVVFWKAPIMKLCDTHDLEGVKALIARGDASALDCDDMGNTTIEVSFVASVRNNLTLVVGDQI